MNDLPGADKIGAFALSIVTAIGGAFTVWKLSAKTKLEVTESNSKGDWIKHIEQQRDEALMREQRALEREQRALELHRAALDKISSMNYTISVLTEKTERQEKKQDILIRLLSKHRPDLSPDLSDIFTSAFGAFEPVPSKTGD